MTLTARTPSVDCGVRGPGASGARPLRRLRRARAAEGDRVTVVSQNSTRMLELLLATTMSGRMLVPINFPLSASEVDYIVDYSGSSVLPVQFSRAADTRLWCASVNWMRRGADEGVES